MTHEEKHMNRRIEWDVDGLSVRCEECPKKTRCDDCEDVHELESAWEDYHYGLGKKPSRPRPEGKR